MGKIKDYLKDVIHDENPVSARRFITLIMAAHLILASFVILFLVLYVIIWTISGEINVDLLNLLEKVLEYDFWIVMSGLGFLTSTDIVQMYVAKNKPVDTQIPFNQERYNFGEDEYNFSSKVDNPDKTG